MAGELGFEPRLTESESAVLLHISTSYRRRNCLTNTRIIGEFGTLSNGLVLEWGLASSSDPFDNGGNTFFNFSTELFLSIYLFQH